MLTLPVYGKSIKKMSLPIVLQLQKDAIDSNNSVSELLRTAKLIATKLDLQDALTWISNEMDGDLRPNFVPVSRRVL